MSCSSIKNKTKGFLTINNLLYSTNYYITYYYKSQNKIIIYNGDKMFNLKDAVAISNKLNIKFDKFSIKDLLNGINTELEHGTINPDTNITNDDLEMTTKIALAHLNEYPNYYNEEYGLKKLEKTLKEKLQ